MEKESDCSNILSDLNEGQRSAILNESKRILVLAGAGSGKTKTIIQKILYLVIEKGISPNRILAITFTKNSTNEMIDRLITISDTTGEYNKIIRNKDMSNNGKNILRRNYLNKYPRYVLSMDSALISCGNMVPKNLTIDSKY